MYTFPHILKLYVYAYILKNCFIRIRRFTFADNILKATNLSEHFLDTLPIKHLLIKARRRWTNIDKGQTEREKFSHFNVIDSNTFLYIIFASFFNTDIFVSAIYYAIYSLLLSVLRCDGRVYANDKSHYDVERLKVH